jgi:hypothetical protein
MNTKHTAPNHDITPGQVLAMATALLGFASIDGVRPEELALIRGFYEQSGVAGLPGFDSVVSGRSAPTPDAMAVELADREFAEQVVLFGFMTGYADGHLSDAEKAAVHAMAHQAGLSDARITALHQQVKDSLIGALSHLPDPSSVAALAKEL